MFDEFDKFTDEERLRVLDATSDRFQMSFLQIKDNILDQINNKLLRNQLDFRNGHLLMVSANTLTNLYDQMMQRGKQDNKFFYDLNAKGLMSMISYRHSINIMNVEIFQHLETFFHMAQMLKIFGPYFFHPQLSKTGETKQFSPFQMLAVLQLLEATRIYEPEMFKIFSQQVEQRLQKVETVEEVLTVLTNQTTT